MYLLCDIREDLDGAAAMVRRALNLPAANRPPVESQKRYGLNIGGGDYYLFDSLGIDLCLCRNAGEVAFPEETDWPYYVWVHSDGDFSSLLESISTRFLAAGIRTKLLKEEPISEGSAAPQRAAGPRLNKPA